MKKTALLLLAFAVAGVYFWNQFGRGTALPASLPATSAPASGASKSYANGTYTGPVTNAYYGNMQVQAIVRGGRLAGVRILQYPNTHGASIAINSQALPMLQSEVVAAQTARVNIISGATLSSEAFMRSLNGALSQAG